MVQSKLISQRFLFIYRYLLNDNALEPPVVMEVERPIRLRFAAEGRSACVVRGDGYCGLWRS